MPITPFETGSPEEPKISPRSGKSMSASEASGRSWAFATGLLVLLAGMPLLALVWQATGDSKGVWPHLISNVLPDSAWITFQLLAGVGAGTLVMGSGTAWLVSRYRFPLRNFLQWALILPLAVPTYLAAYTWGEFVDFTGPIQSAYRALFGFTSSRDYWFPDIRSTGGAVFLLSMVLFPYVYLPARLAFSQQATSLLDVGRVLGAGPWRLFSRVALPAARPALAVGVILALMETLNDIGAVEYLGVRTLTFSVFDTWLNRSSLAGAAQLSLALLVIIAALILLEKKLRRGQKFHNNRANSGAVELIQINGAKAFLASIACLLPVILGFGIPLLQMVRFTVRRPGQMFDPSLISAAWNSIEVSLLVSATCLIAGFILIYAKRRSGLNFFKTATQLAGLGYAIPGTILAIGVLTMLTGLDSRLSRITLVLFDFRAGLLFSGTIAIIIFACSVRFLTIAMGNLEAGYERISPNMTMAARTLGRSEFEALRQIEIPLMAKTMGIAGLLVFVETMKELSATIMLRPFNFDTLATHVYSRASRALFEDASFAALLIVLFGLIPVYVLTRVIISEQHR